MEDKILKESDIPMGYELCFNGGCADKDTCMHYQAMLLTSADRYKGNAVFPTAWQDGKCRCYHEKKLVKKAWGFTNLYNNVPHHERAVARSYVRGFWESGNFIPSTSSSTISGQKSSALRDSCTLFRVMLRDWLSFLSKKQGKCKLMQ